ncbi:glycoside hydrolase [Erwinia typographi]|uniref:Glycoside hydrolase n=1 Tax=Erwinia typographi TaxID=371042 RepID=A0A0A3YRZ7_9GAMM|nr:glycoside hydrolase family 19 protein [Erwinia typographi]KGT88304.1 glycoside hydrolase [Erwinia typographi]
MITVTTEILSAIAVPYRTNKARGVAQKANFSVLPYHLNHWFTVFNINDNKLRVAHFLAQSCCETSQFLSLTEIPKHGGKEYEPNTTAGHNVGNKYPGDGPKFIGRGLLHLTGRENYQKYGNKIHQDLVSHPEVVASNISIAVQTSCLFWSKRDLNTAADNDDFDTVMSRVNGGVANGRDERLAALKRAKKTLGI